MPLVEGLHDRIDPRRDRCPATCPIAARSVRPPASEAGGPACPSITTATVIFLPVPTASSMALAQSARAHAGQAGILLRLADHHDILGISEQVADPLPANSARASPKTITCVVGSALGFSRRTTTGARGRHAARTHDLRRSRSGGGSCTAEQAAQAEARLGGLDRVCPDNSPADRRADRGAAADREAGRRAGSRNTAQRPAMPHSEQRAACQQDNAQKRLRRMGGSNSLSRPSHYSAFDGARQRAARNSRRAATSA